MILNRNSKNSRFATFGKRACHLTVSYLLSINFNVLLVAKSGFNLILRKFAKIIRNFAIYLRLNYFMGSIFFNENFLLL